MGLSMPCWYYRNRTFLVEPSGTGTMLCDFWYDDCLQRSKNDYLDDQNSGSGTAFGGYHCGDCGIDIITSGGICKHRNAGSGSYIYGVMLKSTFKKADYRILVLLLGVYVGVLCIWGKIVEYFGAFLTISACDYAPLAALLFVDFFFVRKQKLDFYSAYEIKGHEHYRYTKGFNIVGMVCLIVGIAISLLIYNPVTGEVHSEFFFYFTPTGCSLLGTGLLYYLLCKLPPIRRYIRKDISISADTKPFDRMKEPPKQNLFLMPFIWLACFLITCPAKLKIVKSDKRGIKPPYLVLGTHHSFTDFYVTPLALFPHRANCVSELEGFEYYGEWIYRQVGCLW